jgi:hypothetical protein
MDDSEPQGAPPVYVESGASWYWLLAGPLAGLAMILVQFRAGMGFQPFVPALFLVLVSGMLALQVKAGRIHTSVELTDTSLREGTEVMPVDEILAVYPEPENTVKAAGLMEKWQGRTLGVNATGPLEQWQTARALGELSGVPRGRTPVGLRLTGGRFVQAWARHPDALRAELTRLVEARKP